jgi:hypothetical protein
MSRRGLWSLVWTRSSRLSLSMLPCCPMHTTCAPPAWHILYQMPRHNIAPSLFIFRNQRIKGCASSHREPKKITPPINPLSLLSTTFFPPLPIPLLYTSIKMVKSAVLGFPRIGENRAMKKVRSLTIATETF